MLKTTTAVMVAAAIAAAFTLLSAPSAPVDAGPLAKPAETVLKDCTQRAWPYLNCVGTAVGNPRVRLVSTDRFN
jgi:hypothetical protein